MSWFQTLQFSICFLLPQTKMNYIVGPFLLFNSYKRSTFFTNNKTIYIYTPNFLNCDMEKVVLPPLLNDGYSHMYISHNISICINIETFITYTKLNTKSWNLDQIGELVSTMMCWECAYLSTPSIIVHTIWPF